MKKKMMKWGSLLTCALLSCTAAACGGNDGPSGETPTIVGDFEMVQLDGDESEVTIVRDGGLNVDAGYADIMIPKKSAVIGDEYAKSPSVALPYLFTKALHNYNVTENNIRLNYLDWGWGEPLMQKSEAAFKAGSGVDILIGESQMPGYAKRGKLQAFPDELADMIRETMHPAAYKAMELDLDGDGDKEIYGLAANPAICTLVWNKDILKRAGIDQQYIDKAPATWAEFTEVCKDVAAAGGARFAAGGVYAGNNYGGYLRMAPFMAQSGGWYVDENEDLDFDNAKNVAPLEFLRDVSRYNLPGALIPLSEETLYTQFSRGKLAYLVDGSWRISMSKEKNMNIGYGALPSPTGAENNNIAIGAAYLSVPDYVTPARAANAFKVIASHCEESVQNILVHHGIRPVSHMTLAESEEYAKVNPVQAGVYQIMKEAEIIALPSFEKDASKIWNTFGEAQEKAADETYYGTDIQSLLNTAQEKALEFLK